MWSVVSGAVLTLPTTDRCSNKDAGKRERETPTPCKREQTGWTQRREKTSDTGNLTTSTQRRRRQHTATHVTLRQNSTTRQSHAVGCKTDTQHKQHCTATDRHNVPMQRRLASRPLSPRLDRRERRLVRAELLGLQLPRPKRGRQAPSKNDTWRDMLYSLIDQDYGDWSGEVGHGGVFRATAPPSWWKPGLGVHRPDPELELCHLAMMKREEAIEEVKEQQDVVKVEEEGLAESDRNLPLIQKYVHGCGTTMRYTSSDTLNERCRRLSSKRSGCWLPDCLHRSTRTLRTVGSIPNHPAAHSGTSLFHEAWKHIRPPSVQAAEDILQSATRHQAQRSSLGKNRKGLIPEEASGPSEHDDAAPSDKQGRRRRQRNYRNALAACASLWRLPSILAMPCGGEKALVGVTARTAQSGPVSMVCVPDPYRQVFMI